MIITAAILIDILAVCFHLIEAAIEAVYKDTRHWFSFSLVLLLCSLLCLLCLPFELWIQLTFICSYIIGRSFFDLFFNFFDKKPLRYQGDGEDDAKTDALIKRIQEQGLKIWKIRIPPIGFHGILAIRSLAVIIAIAVKYGIFI